MARGRPSEYSEAVADTICERLAAGESLRTICRDEALPCCATVFNWMRSRPDFLEQYTRAKEESADALVEDILEIADNQAEQPVLVDGAPLMIDGKMVMVRDAASVNHAKLRVDARKWVASKLKPKKYGDNQNIKVDGEVRYSFAMNYGSPARD